MYLEGLMLQKPSWIIPRLQLKFKGEKSKKLNKQNMYDLNS